MSSSSQSTPAGCEDAGATSVFVVTETRNLYGFDPPSATFSLVGTLNCPSQAGASPFSMAVSRSGTAYIVYGDGELFRASTLDASCQATPFKQGQQGFYVTFGMGFTSNTPAAGETLYVVANQTGQFASIDTGSYALTIIGAAVPESELTGSAMGALYTFFASGSAPTSGATIAQVDKTTGKLGTMWSLPVSVTGGWAFAQWGGDFYTFTGAGGSVVHRFDPTTNSVTQVGTLGEQIVGAGVSTCAPGG
jgi:hypothetical protein